MKKTLKYCYKILQLSWAANKFYAVLSVVGTIYQSTLYPFILVLVLSNLLDRLGSKTLLMMSDLAGIIAIFILSTLILMVITSYLETQSVLLDTRMDNYIDLQIQKKLTQLDPATFENSEFQNLLSQLEGVKGTIGVNVMRITAFIDSVFKLITASIVVSITFPSFVPLMLIAVIPLFFHLMTIGIKYGNIL